MPTLRTARIGLSGDDGKIALTVNYPVPARVGEADPIWLDGECSFAAGPINGSFSLYLTQRDLESMRVGLEHLLAGSAGAEALFETMEQDIILRCSVNKRGLTKIDARINPRDAANVVCTFVFEAGPMALDSSLREVTELLRCIMTD